MTETLPIVLIPGLNCSPRLYAAQISFLWRFGPVMLADHTRDDSIAGVARRILAEAPPRFALVGLSMGGYVAFEMVRQAGNRIAKLARLDTSARPDTPEASERRKVQIEMAMSGRFAEIPAMQWPLLVHPRHLDDERLQEINRQMAAETGPEAFVRQQRAVMTRADSRPALAAIECPTLVLVGEADAITPPALADEMVAGLRDGRLCVVPGSGHLSTLEQPEAVNDALGDLFQAGGSRR